MVVVASVLEQEPAALLRGVQAVSPGCGLVEVRADHLHPDALTQIVHRAGRPVIVTIRRRSEGGAFDGDEIVRRRMLNAALEAGAAFVDVEWGSELEALARGAEARRVILSDHGAPCTTQALGERYRAMAATQAARLKIVPRADLPAEVVAVREILGESIRDGRELACFALGAAGALSRLLCCSWGSWGTYGSRARGAETAEGQFSVDDLLLTYDVLGMSRATRKFALVGERVFRSPSPAMHRVAYVATGIDASYLPVEVASLDDFVPLLDLGIEAFAVTMPFKEIAAEQCRLADEVARKSRAVNTVIVERTGWEGFNTDGPAALELLGSDCAGKRVALVGAGGTARAVGAALVQAGARVTLFNRSSERGRAAADSIGADAAPLAALDKAAWDCLVQTTPLGQAGESVIPQESLGGQIVLDVVYGAEPTPLVVAARRRGLRVYDGLDLLAAQAVRQFERMTGARGPGAPVLRQTARAWLGARG